MPVRGSLTLLRGGDGAPEGLLSTARDMRRRRAADEALRRATEQFTSAFAHAPIGMALVGLDGRFLRVNRALCDLVGYAEADLLRSTFQDITHAEDLDADLALIDEVLRGERASYTMEKRYVRADGRVIWALLAVSLVTGADGVPLHFISQIQDITERRELELRLREQAEHDHLTGLYNRRRFDEELRRADRPGRAQRRGGDAGDDRPRPLQGRERPRRPQGGRRAAAGRRPGAGGPAAPQRHARPPGRRRVRAILVGSDEEAGAAIAHMLSGRSEEVAAAPRRSARAWAWRASRPTTSRHSVLARADEAMYAAKAAGRGAVHVGAIRAATEGPWPRPGPAAPEGAGGAVAMLAAGWPMETPLPASCPAHASASRPRPT